MLLTAPEVLRTESRSVVVRARVVGGGNVPNVVLKHFRDDPVLGLDDWAGLVFLQQRGLRIGPRFLAGSEEARLFVMEDLGRGHTLESLFQGQDERMASGALLAIVRLTALMHIRTLSAQADYDAVRQAIEPRHERARIENARYLLDNAGRLRRWVAEVGAEEAPGTQTDLELLARELADPGPFLAFTHGDMAPSNTLLTRDGPHLLDFEYSGMRHALYDALMWLISVPLPDELIARADTIYRTGLSQACYSAQVDSEYFHARAVVVAARTVNLFQWISPKALERDREWAPGFTERDALLRHLERYRLLLEPLDPVPALSRTLRSLETRLRERWTVKPFVWPAFW
ncbi:phosphotransferase [Hyalangium gracile]|uniref:phosphotransferase n=1 Tax=Hyalangium gracile TaxID=394092 RepID=UPI001CCDD79E|nr:phosphotransferase [Hyalangium gracile]